MVRKQYILSLVTVDYRWSLTETLYISVRYCMVSLGSKQVVSNNTTSVQWSAVLVDFLKISSSFSLLFVVVVIFNFLKSCCLLQFAKIVKIILILCSFLSLLQQVVSIGRFGWQRGDVRLVYKNL